MNIEYKKEKREKRKMEKGKSSLFVYAVLLLHVYTGL